MKQIENFDKVEVLKDFEKLPSGGYVCRITKVEDNSQKEYLKIEFDIAEGKYKGEGMAAMERIGFWTLHTIKSYSEKAQKFFKAFITAVEESNPNYKWNWDEQSLVGKYIGFTIGYEEYKKDDEIKQRLFVDQSRSIEKIRKGEFNVPQLKKLKEEVVTADISAVTEDLPF